MIGTIELVGVIAERLGIDAGPLAWIANINLDFVGYGIVALFVVSWLTALAVWRFGNVEERWSAKLTEPAFADPAERRQNPGRVRRFSAIVRECRRR